MNPGKNRRPAQLRRHVRALDPIAAMAAITLTAASLNAAANPAPGAAVGSATKIAGGMAGNGPVATDAVGDFVTVGVQVQSLTNDVVARLYGADGTPKTNLFRVNTFTTGSQNEPSVAMDAAGDFVVVWESAGQDGDGGGIYGQRYASDGSKLGSEFRVNTRAMGTQEQPTVAMDAAGDFVVAWVGLDSDASWGIAAQRYAADGTAEGGEFAVNTTIADSQIEPAVAMDAAGDFAVTWSSANQDGSSGGVYAQRYAADGSAQGSEFRANTTTSGNQGASVIAMDAAGDFVIAWGSQGQDGSGEGIYAQRYAADGTPQGGEFLVNTHTADDQWIEAASADAQGDFVIGWMDSSAEDGSGEGTFAQRYSTDGNPVGSEFQVNTATASDQEGPMLALDAAGDLTATWLDTNGSFSIYFQRYTRESSIDLGAGLGIAPSGTVAEGSALALTATVSDTSPALTPTGVASVDVGLNAATGITATFTLPVGSTLTSSSGTHWTCPATLTGATLTCNYGAALVASADASTLTVNVTAPQAEGVASYSVDIAANQPDSDSSDDSDSDGVDVSGHAPVSSDGNLSVDENTSGNGTVSATDTDGDSLTYRKLSGPAHGSATVNADGSYSYTPTINYHGPDSFSFAANDGSYDSNAAVISVTVNHVNQAPVAGDKSLNLDENTSGNGTLSATDVDGDSLSYSVASGPSHGNATVNPDGSYSYTPAANYHGFDSFTFKASDGALSSNAGTVSVTVNHINQVPVASDMSLNFDENGSSSGSLSASDADGDSLSYTRVRNAVHGTTTVNSDGSYSYTPNSNFHGSDSFTFKVSDGSLTSNTATVSIMVNFVDQAPMATAGSLAVNRNTAKAGTVSSTDVDSSSRTYAKATDPAHGTLILNSNGSYSYKPARNFAGSDSFTFTANDGTLSSSPATVSITVTEHTPVATGASFGMTHNTTHSGQLKGTDADTGDTKTFSKVKAPAHGTLTLKTTGAYSYKPTANFKGKDSFTFHVGDGTKVSNTATISITVN